MWNVGDEFTISKNSSDCKIRVLKLIWNSGPNYCVYEAQDTATGERLALKQGCWDDVEWELEWDALQTMSNSRFFPKGFYLSKRPSPVCDIPRFMLMELLGSSLDEMHHSMGVLHPQTIGSLGIQAIDRFCELHSMGIIQNDTFKTNSASLLRVRIGVSQDMNQLFLLHFSHMRRFEPWNSPAAPKEDLLPFAKVLLSLSHPPGLFDYENPAACDDVQYKNLYELLEMTNRIQTHAPNYRAMRRLMEDMVVGAGFEYRGRLIYEDCCDEPD